MRREAFFLPPAALAALAVFLAGAADLAILKDVRKCCVKQSEKQVFQPRVRPLSGSGVAVCALWISAHGVSCMLCARMIAYIQQLSSLENHCVGMRYRSRARSYALANPGFPASASASALFVSPRVSAQLFSSSPKSFKMSGKGKGESLHSGGAQAALPQHAIAAGC